MDSYFVLDIETHGLNPWFGDYITCICAKDSEGHMFKTSLRKEGQELEMLKQLVKWITENGHVKSSCIVHNGLAFDIPFLLTRGAINGFDVKGVYTNLRYFDTMKIIKKWISLQELATLLACDNKNGTGENAIKLYDEKRFDELEAYCMNDVEITEQVYLTWKKLNKEKKDIN